MRHGHGGRARQGMASASGERFSATVGRGPTRRVGGSGASRCHVGSLFEAHGAGWESPATGSRIICRTGSPSIPPGLPRIFASSGDHSQAAQHSRSAPPAKAISMPTLLPSAGSTAGRTSSNSGEYPRTMKMRVPSLDHAATAFQTASGGAGSSRSPVPSSRDDVGLGCHAVGGGCSTTNRGCASRRATKRTGEVAAGRRLDDRPAGRGRGVHGEDAVAARNGRSTKRISAPSGGRKDLVPLPCRRRAVNPPPSTWASDIDRHAVLRGHEQDRLAIGREVIVRRGLDGRQRHGLGRDEREPVAVRSGDIQLSGAGLELALEDDVRAGRREARRDVCPGPVTIALAAPVTGSAV